MKDHALSCHDGEIINVENTKIKLLKYVPPQAQFNSQENRVGSIIKKVTKERQRDLQPRQKKCFGCKTPKPRADYAPSEWKKSNYKLNKPAFEGKCKDCLRLGNN